MSENNDEINKKLDELKEEADQHRQNGTVRVGGHEVRVVAKDSTATVSPTFLDKLNARVKSKAKDTYTDVFVPWVEDLLYNTLDDFLYRMIYRKDGQPPVRNGGSSRKSGYTDYGWHSNGLVGGSFTRAATSSREDPYSREDAEIYRSIIVDNLGTVKDVFDEVNRLMLQYPCATISDAYTAAKQSYKTQPEDLNYGWTRDRYPNGIAMKYARINGRDKDNRPITLYRCIFPEPEDVEN